MADLPDTPRLADDKTVLGSLRRRAEELDGRIASIKRNREQYLERQEGELEAVRNELADVRDAIAKLEAE